MKWLGLAMAVLASGCSRCGSSSVADAAAPARARRSIDLRSALILTFPEYRGAYVDSGTATLTRTFKGPGVREALTAAMAHNGFTALTDGGAGAERNPFRMNIVREGPVSEVSISLVLDQEVVARIYGAPNSLGTMELGLMLPKPTTSLAVVGDVFTLELHYWATTASRAAFLARQLIDLSLANQQWKARSFPEVDAGWEPDRKPDGGFGGVPEVFDVTLEGVVDGALIAVHRAGKHVDVTYTLVTDAPGK